MDPFISIVIPVRNQPGFLASLLGSIEENAPDDAAYEVLVVDDCSDEPVEALCGRFGARCLRQPEPLGPAAARNHGAESASGDVLLFLDADVLCPPGLLERVAAELGPGAAADAVSFPNQAYRHVDSLVRNFGAVLDHHWARQFMAGRSRIRINGFQTRCGAVRAESFHAIGGFDATFRTNAMEDYDFGKRLAARFESVGVDGPVVYHRYPDSFVRVLRNTFVRVRLFVPYTLRNRPSADRAQTTPGEGALRMAPPSSAALLAAAAVPSRAQWLFLAAALAVVAVYLVSLRGFIQTAWHVSGSWRFALLCVPLHWCQSLAVPVGGMIGLADALLPGRAGGPAPAPGPGARR